MAVFAGMSYRLTLDAWCSEDFRGPLTATLESAAGAVYARAEVSGLTPMKQRLTVTLTAKKSDMTDSSDQSDSTTTAHLVLSATTPGMLYFDFVSLFPLNTWKRRENGLRAELAELVAACALPSCVFPAGVMWKGID